MPRDLATTLGDAIEAPVVRPFIALFVDLPDPVRAWTGTGTIHFNGHDWIGIGGVASIGTIGEDVEGTAAGVQAQLFEVPAEFRDDIADQAVRGCAMELWTGALNETYQQIEGVKLLRRARLSEYDVDDQGDVLTVTVTGESRALDQRRPAIKRYTDDYQQSKFAGDRFFEFVPQMAEIPILWAAASQDSIAAGGGSGSGIGALFNRVQNV